MGILSWMGKNSRRQAAVDAIHLYFEVCKKLGAFPPADPRGAAQDAVDLALARVPELIERRWSKYGIAATCLAIVLLEEDEPLAVRDYYAMALRGMLEAADLQRHQLSFEELAALDSARRAYLAFRSIVPSPMHAAAVPGRIDPGPQVLSDPFPEFLERAEDETASDREAARTALVQRMRESGGRRL